MITPAVKKIPENNHVNLIDSASAIKPLAIKPIKAPDLENIDSSDKIVARFFDSM